MQYPSGKLFRLSYCSENCHQCYYCYYKHLSWDKSRNISWSAFERRNMFRKLILCNHRISRGQVITSRATCLKMIEWWFKTTFTSGLIILKLKMFCTYFNNQLVDFFNSIEMSFVGINALHIFDRHSILLKLIRPNMLRVNLFNKTCFNISVLCNKLLKMMIANPFPRFLFRN